MELTFTLNRTMQANVTPQVLRWARETAGHTFESTAKALRRKTITPDVVQAWEAGKASPTFAQLKRLGEMYQRPIALFFFPEPPDDSEDREKFRSFYAKNLSPKMHFLVRRAKTRQIELEELGGASRTQTISDIHASDIDIRTPKSAVNLAQQARVKMGVSISTQKKWKDAEEALKQWRKSVEDTFGVWVFKESFPDSDYSGFCINHSEYPVIYIHNGETKSRQIFSLFHELGHILLGSSTIDFREFEPKTNEMEEIFCNAFAGAVLIPESENIGEAPYPGEDAVKLIADDYNVSFDVVLRKYRSKGALSQSEYQRIRQKRSTSRPAPAKSRVQGNYYLNQRTYLGEKYLELAFRRHHQGRIDEYELANYLGISVNHLPVMEEYIASL